MNREAIVVVGANYGDEGKGLATHYFTQRALARGSKVLNVLYNGGPQRGHTVEYKNGLRHVFHHFGSGFFDGAPTYFDEDFMVNPIMFRTELEKLRAIGCEYGDTFCTNYLRSSNCYISPKCRVITPWDCMINQIVEESRGRDRHGSCGAGIWETQKRYEDPSEDWCLDYEDMVRALKYPAREILKRFLKAIRDEYVPKRLKEAYGITEIPKKYQNAFYSDGLIDHFIEDLEFMSSYCHTVKEFEYLVKFGNFRTVIFEGGQGLALDEGNKEALPHVTASKTGSAVPIERARDICDYIEVCYVTRSYFTRHGAGPFPTECPVSELGWENPTDGLDLTNVPNKFQGHFRYGKFDFDEFRERVNRDILNSLAIRTKFIDSCMVTHCNEVPPSELPAKAFTHGYYTSDTRFAEDIVERGRSHLAAWRKE